MRVGHGLSEEVWASRFATAFCHRQPSVGRALALELAALIRPSLGVLRPEDAVQTFLELQLTAYEAAGDAAGEVLRLMRCGRETPIAAPRDP
jgi:hypothetical protein